ncbi:hypothetical protein NDU88_005517 [Pleurodeles waltl]|uniref:Uncharacterized protein n=1 Tax=Pleurodeles waltl TaxID=8319 RepID=A0AAV7QG66_PLEWA|nr:hypothetical protein NDU88_005517 [Pleurodeles waltl]
MRTLQVVQNSFLRVLLGLGPGTALAALYADLNFSPILNTAALRPILYGVRIVRNHQAAVYLGTLREVTSSGIGSNRTWLSPVQKILNKLQMVSLWEAPCGVRQDAADLIKKQYYEHVHLKKCRKLKPGTIVSDYFSDIYGPYRSEYVDMLYLDVKRTL